MNHDHDVDWLLEHRPETGEPSPESTERARAALITHGVRRRRGHRRAGAFAAAGAIAAAGAAVAIATDATPGHGRDRRVPTRIAASRRRRGRVTGPAPHIRQTPLVELASDVRALPTPRQRGDATLVVRDTLINGHHVIDGAVYGGYDLYTDSGRYYYAPDSLAQLQQTFDNHQVVAGDDEAHVLSVLAAAATDTPRQARVAALRTWPRPPSRRGDPAPRHETARELRLHYDSELYIIATQALAVGAGRPDVRAGAMNALDTLSGVTETPVRVHDIRALRVRFPDGSFLETIWLDARTGVPIQEQDGASSATAYAVERVTAAHLPSHISTTAQLR